MEVRLTPRVLAIAASVYCPEPYISRAILTLWSFEERSSAFSGLPFGATIGQKRLMNGEAFRRHRWRGTLLQGRRATRWP